MHLRAMEAAALPSQIGLKLPFQLVLHQTILWLQQTIPRHYLQPPMYLRLHRQI
jgi:hypothetical protein